MSVNEAGLAPPAVSPTGKRRGRPYRPPEDVVPAARPVVDPAPRVGWILGTWRIFAKDGQYIQRRTFVQALRDLGIACDETRVSRWESGAQVPSNQVIFGYEQILGLTYATLVSSIDTALVHAGGGLKGPREMYPPASDLDRLLDLAVGHRPTGAEWIELLFLLEETQAVFLSGDEWAAMARKLALELSRSVGSARLTRAQALGRLIKHPQAQRHVLKALGECILDRRIARRHELVWTLTSVPNPTTFSLLSRMLGSDDEPLARGAAFAASALISIGAYEPDAITDLVEPLMRHLRRYPDSEGGASLTAVLPALLRDQVAEAINALLVSSVTIHHTVVDPTAARAAARRMAKRSAPTADHLHTEPDGMLVKLIQDAVFNGHRRRRCGAVTLLAGSAYAAEVSAACIAELDAGVSHSRWVYELLCSTVQAGDGPAVAKYASAGYPDGTRINALSVLPLVPGDPAPEVISVIHQAVMGPSSTIQEAAVYAAGMLDVMPELPEDHPMAERAALWAELGPRIMSAADAG